MKRRLADLYVTLAGLALLLAWDLSGLDLAVMRALADDEQGFAWRQHWLTAQLIHGGGRVAGWLLIGLLAVNVARPLWAGPSRAERWRWLAVTALCLLGVPALKQISHTSCPWDLAEFGGWAAYVSHWQFGVGDGGPGRCFPSGHATAAFAFFSGWFALREYRPRAARRWLVGVLLLGVVYGGGQTLRGAHFPSHSLWTAWLCWACCAALMPPRRPALPQPVLHPTDG